MSKQNDNNGRDSAREPGDPDIQGMPDKLYGDCVNSFRAKEFARARDCFESWVKDHPNDAEARHQLARVLMHLNERFDEAESHLKSAMTLSPVNKGRYLATYGELLVHIGRFAESVAVLEETLERGISPDPGGVMRYVAEHNLSLARKKLKSIEGLSGKTRPERAAEAPEGPVRTAGKGGMFFVQSVVVHVLAMVLLSILSGMHGRPPEPEDYTIIDLAPPPVEEQAAGGEGGGGGGGGTGGSGGTGAAEESSILPGPIARLLGMQGPERAAEEARELQGPAGARSEEERSDEALKGSASLDSARAEDSMQAKLDTARLESGFDLPRPGMSVPDAVRRADGLDIDTGQASSAGRREAEVSGMSERTPAGAVTSGRVSGSQADTGERGAAGGQKSAAGMEAVTAGSDSARFEGGGSKSTTIGDIAAIRPGLDSEFMPDRSPLDIDAGVATGAQSASRSASGAEDVRRLDRSATGTASSRISSGGASVGERSSASGTKSVSDVARADSVGGVTAPAPSAHTRTSDIGDLPASRNVSVPSDIGRRADLDIAVSGGEPASAASAVAPKAPSEMGERSVTVARAGSGVRSAVSSDTGRDYSPAAGAGAREVGRISSAGSADSLTVPVAPSALGRSGPGGPTAGTPVRGGPDISSVSGPGRGGGGLEGLFEGSQGTGGTGTGTGTGTGGTGTGGTGKGGGGGGGTERTASVSGPGRGAGSGTGGAAARPGTTSGSGGRGGVSGEGGKGFAGQSLGRPVTGGSEKYRSASGTEAMPKGGEKYASLGPKEKAPGRPGAGRGPKVRIITPTSGKTEQMAQTVSGTVGGARVDKATLAVNNDSRVISVEGGRFNASVALFEGRNIITVMAFDREGNVGKDFVTLDYKTPESDLIVKITEPKDGQVYDLSDKSTIMVRGTVGDSSIRHAKLVLNGNPKDVAIEGGRFEQELALVKERNRLFVEATGKNGEPANSGEISFSTMNIKPKDMMVILTWDKPHADMDLHIIGPAGGHTYYKNPDKYTSNEAIPEGRLEQDAKDNYGPEVFTMEKADPGIYTIKSNYYYSGGDGDAHATVTVILYGDNPARRIVRVFGPHLQTDTKTGEDMWVVARLKMPEGIFLED